MIRLMQTASTSLDRATVFDQVGDFANIDRWDPGVISATKATPGEVGVGTVYDLTVAYNGRELEMSYRITDHDPGRRIVLEGSGPWIKAIDVIEFADQPDGTMVTYTADLGLTGVGRLIEPLLRNRFDEIGRKAGDGLRRLLGELEDAYQPES